MNEAWLKLAGHLDRFADRRHFLRVAGRAMRQVLASHAEAARAAKRDAPAGARSIRASADARSFPTTRAT